MTITMPDVAATRAAMLNAYRDGLRALIEDATEQVTSGPWEGVPVVTRKALDEAVSAIFGAPIPMPDETWAEVHTPATVVVSLICPECELPTPSLISIRSELLVSDDGKELRPKAKGKGKTHICGQLSLPAETAEGQTSFELADIIGEPAEEPEGGEAPADEAEPDDYTDPLEVADPLYAIVRDGETLDEALARIETLDDYNRVIGSAAGQALLEALKENGAGSRVPFPADPS